MGAHGGGRMGEGPWGRAPTGGAWAPSNIFVGGGELKKAPHSNKKDSPHREKSIRKALTCMVKKAPHKGKNVPKKPYHNKKPPPPPYK